MAVSAMRVRIEHLASTATALQSIVTTANLRNRILIVESRYDEQKNDEPFGLGTCPQARITVTLPNLTAWDARPLLNVSMHGPEGGPIFEPWIPNLVPVLGAVTVAGHHEFGRFAAAFVSNSLGSVQLSDVYSSQLAAWVAAGDLTAHRVVAGAVRLLSQQGNVVASAVRLVPPAEVGARQLARGPTPTYQARQAELAALGYGALGRMHASSISGDVAVTGVEGGDVELYTGGGSVSAELSTLSFGGSYDLAAPFGSATIAQWRLPSRQLCVAQAACAAEFGNSTLGASSLVAPARSIFAYAKRGVVNVGVHGEQHAAKHQLRRDAAQVLRAESSRGDVTLSLVEGVQNVSRLAELLAA